MSIYLGWWNSEKLKRLYKWSELLVWWDCEINFYYDFRSKTSTQLTSDWWIYVSWSWNIWSSWLHWQSLRKDLLDLSDAKKITLISTVNKTDQSAWSSWTMTHWLMAYLSSNSKWYAIWWSASTLSSYYSWVLYNYEPWDNPSDFNHRTHWTWVTLPYWEAEFKTVIDLQNKKATVTYTQSWSVKTSLEYTLSDSLISQYRTYTYINAQAENSSWSYLYDLSVKVE